VGVVARLGTADLDGALRVVREAAVAEGEQPFELPVVQQLATLVPADRAGYVEYRKPDPCCGVRPNIYEADTQPMNDVDWDACGMGPVIESWPLYDRSRGCPDHACVLKLTDFLTPRELRRNLWYLEVMRHRPSEHEMKFWLPARTGIVRGFFFIREPGRPDFSERDRALLTVLRPHLSAIRERWERRHQPDGLTRRETELLQLLRRGFTNQEIADRLVISTGTVRTHLENIFDKLDVHTRTAAVARAFSQVD
jgi:DNA-binding CsgD family transcriptional regulator